MSNEAPGIRNITINLFYTIRDKKLHGRVNPYECDICNKDFSRSNFFRNQNSYPDALPSRDVARIADLDKISQDYQYIDVEIGGR